MDASQYEHFNTTIKAAYCHTFKRSATRMDEMVFGPDQMKNSAYWETSYGGNNFSPCAFKEKTLRIGRDGSYLIRSLWYVTLGDIRPELSLRSYSSQKGENVARLLKMFSTNTVKVLKDLVTEREVQLGHPYASYDIVVAVARRGYAPDGIVPSL